MATSADDVLKQALDLGEAERARLITELLATFAVDTATSSLGDAEWIVEIEKRARAALTGRPGIPWNDARKHIEDRFGRE